jgi:transcriptional regulator with XRE-family HTH domain
MKTPPTPSTHPPRTLREYLEGPPRRSQDDLAADAGCTQSMISMLVRGQRQPRADLAVRLHTITRVPLAVLLAPRRRTSKRRRAQEDA